MCLGNRAESSAHYVNSQIVSQWENAQRCSQMHGTGLKPTRSEVEYGTCLFEFYGPGTHSRVGHASKEDLSCFMKFGAPRLEFVCNHEVILYFDIAEGFCNLDTSKASTKREQHVKIDNSTCAFRLTFNTHTVDNVHCHHIGNSDSYTMNLLVLDTASAEFCAELSHLHAAGAHDRKVQAIVYYLSKHYLPTLKRAGLHVLHSLPDFDNITSTSAHIDYSVISRRTLSTNDLYGFSVNDINTYLKGLWLQAAAHIDEHGADHHDHSQTTKYYLAEHRSVWTDAVEDINFHAYLGPLQIQALCKREVVVYLDLQDVHFHIGGGWFKEAHHTFSNWKVAILVDITFEEADGGAVKRIKLDLSTARFCEHLSIMTAEFEDTELFIRLKTTLVRYVMNYYLSIMESAGHYCVFHHDTRTRHHHHHEIHEHGSSDEEEEEIGCHCEDEHSCGHGETEGHIRWGVLAKQRTHTCHVHDFDIITAVTQGSINAHFKSLWELARRKVTSLGSRFQTWSSTDIEIETCLAEYSLVHADHGSEVFFSTSFGAPQIQLLCNEGSRSVVLYLHLQEGYLKTLDHQRGLHPGGNEHNFVNWRVAFTIDLKLQDTSDQHKVPESLLKRLGRHSHSGFKQLVLDFSTAKLNLDRSTIPGLMDEIDFKLIRSKRVALTKYLTSYYFPTLIRAGHHVLYTIPLSGKDASGHQKHSLTSIKFQIYPLSIGTGGSFLQGLFGRHRSIYERNTIVFLGMTDNHVLPHGHLPPGCNFVVGAGKDVPEGTVVISRKTFLEGSLMYLLAAINRDTTVLPAFSGVDGGEWILKLTTWGKHQYKKSRPCGWKEVSGRSDGLDFEWKYRDEWRYDHEGDDGSNGIYSVKCTTHNTMSVPTTHRNGTCAIMIQGKVHLKLGYEGVCKDWSSEMSSTWSAAIILASDAQQGLKIQIKPTEIKPEHHSSHTSGELGHSTFASAFAQLKNELPAVIDFHHIIKELKGSFEGTWSHLHVTSRDLVATSPAFNRRGDLLLELKVREAQVNGHSKNHQPSKGSKKQTPTRPTVQHSEESWFRSVQHKASGLLHSNSSKRSSTLTLPHRSSDGQLSNSAKAEVSSITASSIDHSTAASLTSGGENKVDV